MIFYTKTIKRKIYKSGGWYYESIKFTVVEPIDITEFLNLKEWCKNKFGKSRGFGENWWIDRAYDKKAGIAIKNKEEAVLLQLSLG
jgi:hypothetical protein